MKSKYARESSWTSSSARVRKASARLCAAPAPGHRLAERSATFCRRAAEVATIAAAAEPLAGAGAAEAISVSRSPSRTRLVSVVFADLCLAPGNEGLELLVHRGKIGRAHV